MGKNYSEKKLRNHKERALEKVDAYIENLITSNNPKTKAKSDKLCYWLEDYTSFLSFEDAFTPTSLKKYKRGEIVKAHLGYNIGSEQGGLHYCVVIEKNNSIHSPVINVIPLTSIKDGKNISNLPKSSIYLGDDLYNAVNKKATNLLYKTRKELDDLTNCVNNNIITDNNIIKQRINRLKKDLHLAERIAHDFNTMKIGSIALVNQITTISKIRIYDAKTTNDVLHDIRLSNENLDKIDNAIKELFTNL